MKPVCSGEFNGHFNLNIFQHGAVLGRERGFITCKADGQAERRFENRLMAFYPLHFRGGRQSKTGGGQAPTRVIRS
jgi:hypothetical protein